MISTAVFPTAEEAASALAQACAECLQAAVDSNGEASLVAAGGLSFLPVYAALSGRYAEAVAWEKVLVFLGDERAVPHDDPLSNGPMVRSEFIQKFPEARRPRFLPIITGTDALSAASAYDLILPDRFDLALLGLGPDGHTASLFPGSKPIWDADERLAVTQAELAPFVERITLTPAAFSRSDQVLALATGSAKAVAVAGMSGEHSQDYPLTHIHPASGEVRLFIDKAASGQSGSDLG